MPQRHLTAEGLRAIVAASSSLSERIVHEFRPGAGARHGPSPAQALARWKQLYRDVGRGVFHRRLALDGWTEAMVKPLLGAVTAPSDVDLPAWASTLCQCVNATLNPTSADRSVDPSDRNRTSPFHEVLEPTIQVAATELRRRAADHCRHLSAAAFEDAEAALLHSLVQVSAPTLTLGFQAFRSARESTVFRMLRRLTDQTADELYRAYLAELRMGGLLELLSAYPVLGRFWGLIVESWIGNMTEFLARLDDDLPVLRDHFGVDGRVGPLNRLRLDLSDRHHGGRTVMLLDFPDARRVIYKPKGLGLEKTYNQLLSWLNGNGSPVPLRAIEIVDRTSYGWVEFVDHVGCQSRADVARYYHRAGGLLCLIHLLEGTDCHQENIVAAGAEPVLVDAETLMHHRVASTRGFGDGDPGQRAIDDYRWSVYRTSMLPNWTLDAAGTPVDTSGLGGFGEQATLRQLVHWDSVNSDELQLRYGPGQVARAHNIPTRDGEIQSPLDFEPELLSGFSDMYGFWQQHKASLASRDGPLSPFEGQVSRFIARDSAVYGALRSRLVLPSALASGIAQSMELEHLAVAHLAGPTWPGAWPLVRAEMAALLRFDIPYFSARTDSTAVDLVDGERIVGCFEGPSFDQVLTKISTTGSKDLRTQVGFIRAAFFSRSAHTSHQRHHSRRSSPHLELPDAIGPDQGIVNDEWFVARARRIAEQLRGDSIRVDGGGVAWIGLDYQQRARRYQYQPLGYGFYSGQCGPGLFLAALWSVTREERWREFAVGAVVGVRRGIAESGARRGWSIADASLAYALGRMAVFLEDEGLARDALTVAERIAGPAIAADETFDVLFGSAGGVLSFLTLHRLFDNDAALAKAVACGDRLLQGRTITRTGHRAWASGGSSALTGFSHGAAGVALALLRLGAATGHEAFREAAREAIAFERAVFDEGQGNWPDFRSTDGPSATGKFMTAWCHGATGIGLSRLAATGLLVDGIAQTEVDAALAATRRYGFESVDQLCCGNFGRIELLLAAGHQLHRPDLVAEARSQASRRADLAERNSGYRLMHRLPRWVRNPGFFQGISGIGYGLLRLARPSDLPILLRWD